MSAPDTPDELWLSGYVPVGRHGFALPCYAHAPNANAWYAASATIDGDHESSVASFTLLDEEYPVERLPDEQIASVRIGDAWLDVFLLDGRAFSGTPVQIYEALSDDHVTLGRLAPLSLLDLALAADAPKTPKLAARAARFLKKRYGAETARDWFERLVVEPGVRLALRRQFGGLPGPSPDLRTARIRHGEAQSGITSVTLPLPMVRALQMAGRLEDARLMISRFANEVGVTIVTTAAGHDKPRETHLTSDSSTDQMPDGDILVIAPGGRAQAIVRHLAPASNRSRKVLLRPSLGSDRVGEESSLDLRGSHSRVHVTDGAEPSADLGTYRVIIWVADDKAYTDGGTVKRIVELSRWVRNNDCILMLAPALPASGPSRLSDPDGGSLVLDLGVNALIDTSFARSPFWSGPSRRSIDRRMADIILLAGRAASVDDALRTMMKGKDSRPKPVILTVGTADPNRFTSSKAMTSELSAIKPDRRGSPDLLHRSYINVRGEPLAAADSETAELRRFDPDFPTFAGAVAGHALGGWHRLDEVGMEVSSLLPEWASATLEHSTMATAVILPERISYDGVVISAETPTLQALQAAEAKRWGLVRYTDRETLRNILTDKEWARAGALPREIVFPRLLRQTRNRRLATRGVDPRDVVRLSQDEWGQLVSATPGSSLIESARLYLPSIEMQGQALEIVLPAPAVTRAIEARDPLARAIGKTAAGKLRRVERAGKRLADLRSAWSGPTEGARRFALEDGRLPVRITRLRNGEVPAQRMFIVDGDGSVPALLTSRMFRIWARASMPLTTSWSARFQVGRTFETFPVPREFNVIHMGDGPSQLRVADRSGPADRLMEKLRSADAFLDEILAVPGHGAGSWVGHPLVEEVDELLLQMVGLDPNSSDLDILVRLVELNQRGEASN